MFPDGYYPQSFFDDAYFHRQVAIIIKPDEIRVYQGGGPDFAYDLEQIMREDDEIIAIIIAGIHADLI